MENIFEWIYFCGILNYFRFRKHLVSQMDGFYKFRENLFFNKNATKFLTRVVIIFNSLLFQTIDLLFLTRNLYAAYFHKRKFTVILKVVEGISSFIKIKVDIPIRFIGIIVISVMFLGRKSPIDDSSHFYSSRNVSEREYFCYQDIESADSVKNWCTHWLIIFNFC